MTLIEKSSVIDQNIDTTEFSRYVDCCFEIIGICNVTLDEGRSCIGLLGYQIMCLDNAFARFRCNLRGYDIGAVVRECETYCTPVSASPARNYRDNIS